MVGYSSITAAILFGAIKRARKNPNSYTLLNLFLAIFVIASLITSKDYLFMFVGLSVGVYSNVYKGRFL